MLLVDDRAGSADLVPMLRSGGIEVIDCRLEGADVAISGNGPIGELLIGVEVKKIPDLLSSEATGRLAATQLPNLMENFNPAYLLTIGDYRAGVNGRLEVRKAGDRWTPYHVAGRAVPYAYLEAFLTEIQALGVNLKQVSDERMACCWLIVLRNWWGKPWDKHKAMRKFDQSGKGPSLMPDITPIQMQIATTAASFPRIGWEKAMAAADVFDSVDEMMVATASDWARVPGVGKVIGRSIVEARSARRSQESR